MKFTIDHPSETEAVLNVEFEWPELEKASDRAYKKLAQKYTVPGFRRGHAPRTMIERMLGKEAIYQEGLEDLIETSYRDAVRESDLAPIGQPSLEAPPLEMGQPYSYHAHIPLLGPVTLGDYKSIRVSLGDGAVTDEEVDAQLERIRENAALWLPAERAAQVEDKVSVDLKLTVGEKVVSDLKDNEFELTIERPGIFAGLDDHIVGMKEGESAEFTTTIPEDYANPDLAGKEAQYEVTVKAIRERQLPELDDEFAKEQSGLETLDAMRDALREQMRTQKQSDARRELREQTLNAATEGTTVDIHPILVQEETDAMIRETTRLLDQNRISFPQFLQMMQKSEEDYRKEQEPEARTRVKRDLTLNAVADAEQIEANDEEMQEWLNLFTSVGGNAMRLKDLSTVQRANVRGRIRRDKALAFLVETATEGKIPASGEPVVDASGDDSVVDEATTSAAKAAAVAAPDAAETATAPTAEATTIEEKTEVPEAQA